MVLPSASFRRLDRAVGLDPPEQLVGAGHLRRDDAVGRGFAAFHIGADGAEDAVRHGDVDAAGGDGRDRLRAALGVEHLDLEAGVLEEAGGLAELDPGAVPESLLRDRDLELLRPRGSRWFPQSGWRAQPGSFFVIACPPSAFGFASPLAGILPCRIAGHNCPGAATMPQDAALIGRGALSIIAAVPLPGGTSMRMCRPSRSPPSLIAAGVAPLHGAVRTKRSSWPIRRSA